MKSIIFMIILSIICLGCDHEEDASDEPPEILDEIILGEYSGALEIFYGDSLYMEKITLTVQRLSDIYVLYLNSKAKLSVEAINLNVLSINAFEDKNDIIYVEMIENQFYKTKEVGSYFNTIYINDILYNQAEGPCTEIRLSLVCLKDNNISHIFIRVKKFLQ